MGVALQEDPQGLWHLLPRETLLLVFKMLPSKDRFVAP